MARCVKAFACRTSLSHRLAPAGQGSIPCSWREKASARDPSRCSPERFGPLPWSILFWCVFHRHEHRRGFFGGSPRGCRVPGPLASAAQALAAASTPKGRAICQRSCPHRVEEHQRSGSASISSSARTAIFGSTPLIDIQNSFDENPVSFKGREEEGDRPIRPPRWPTALGGPGSGGTMASCHDAGLGQYAHPLATSRHQRTRPPHCCSLCSPSARGGQASTRLHLRMLQDVRASGPCHNMHPSLHQFSHGSCVAIWPIQTNQSDLRSESKQREASSSWLAVLRPVHCKSRPCPKRCRSIDACACAGPSCVSVPPRHECLRWSQARHSAWRRRRGGGSWAPQGKARSRAA
jgi:hypothetical protein